MKCLSTILAIWAISFSCQLPLVAQNPPETAKSDSILNLIKSFSTERVMMDSLMIIRNDLNHENCEAYAKAIDAGIAYYKSNGKDTAVAHLVYTRAHLFKHLSEYPEALVRFNESLERYKELSHNEQIGRCYYNIGWIHHKQKNFERFLEYAKLASKYYQLIPENNSTCSGIMTLAIAYYLNDSLDQSLNYFKEYYYMAERIQDAHHISQALGKLGMIYYELKIGAAMDSARKYYEMEWVAAKRDSTGRALLMAGIDMGELEKNHKNYEQAQYYFKVALEKAKHLGKQYEKQWIERTMAETYALAGEYDKAYQTFLAYTHSKDSIFSEEKNLQVTELEKKYETAEKDKQITLLAKEKELQAKETQRQATLKNAFIGGLILLAIIAALIFYTMQQRLKNQKIIVKKNDEIKNANFKQQLGELENKALRSQMNPHFIFNCMNSINRMILEQETDGASLYLTKFAKLIRLMLENSEKPTVSLDNELAMLESYIQLEALTNKGKISYEISVDPEVDREAIHIPAMVLQPFIENAIWHGLMPKKDEEGRIKITITEEDDLLKCGIEDNGVGREKALELKKKAVLKSTSMGLSITQKRLQLLSKKELQEMICFTDLKNDADQPSGTRVDVLIPIC